MKNAKSTIAMRLAHKLQKANKKAFFSDCLKQAWVIVRHSMQTAQRIIMGRYNIIVEPFYHADGIRHYINVTVEKRVFKFFKRVVERYTTMPRFKKSFMNAWGL